ncbi:MAG: hypothetical protein AMXMBFR34_43330 [Myxococcaceae bacterium]
MKTTRLILFAGFLVGLGVSLADCGGTSTPKCDATNCPAGCCTAAGQCAAGTTPAACGMGGAACTVCAAGSLCNNHSCPSATGGGAGGGTGGGTGGGATGGGTGGGATGGGTGGGGMVTCSQVVTFGTFTPNQVSSVRRRRFTDGTVENRVRFDADVDAGIYVYQHLYFDPQVDMPPLNHNLGTLPDGGPLTWLESLGTGSAMALGQCDATGVCSQLFLSQGGTSTWTAVGADTSGRMAGSASTIRLVEWNWEYDSMRMEVVADEPVANPTCIDVAAWSFDLEYFPSLDGGYVMPFDAGM